MTATLIDGKEFAAGLKQKIADETAALSARGVTPGLAVILVGSDPASQSYVGSKKKTAQELGFHSEDIELPETVTEQELIKRVRALNDDKKIHGILVQLPLPKHISEENVLGAIDPAKDVDGFHDMNAGRLAKGKKDGFIPCTPLGSWMLLKHYVGDLSGKNAVVVGRSNIVGKPMAVLLEGENCTVTKVHSKTQPADFKRLCLSADILVVAMGKPEYISGDLVKPGAVVIDVGINRIMRDGKSKLVGDVNFAEAAKKASAITPVPGGVGPMTIACLMDNTLKAACQINRVDRTTLAAALTYEMAR